MISQDNLLRIWEGCKANNRKQQELLYRLLSPRMMAVCMRYTSDRDEAQDVMQEGFIKIFKNINNYRGEGSLEGWIRRIMVHTAISRYRKLKPVTLTDEVPENSTPYYTSAQNNNLEAKELMGIIQQLPNTYRSVFNLYAIEGYSHQEIGSMLGISELLSRTTLHRARGILKKKVMQLDAVA
ncbi:RNA polymerase sigma factor [Mucilaginibacter ginkgonis]|uniref:RNA polymerase sigma factor n=1 Tax=Mucilaginibacter ginkgonis TaxID=2682091 RepID=A0A6I4I103_9SPHI|nr:RNA polymerase sigma factor [Mucilaginibacter ginkgonis]QQL48570.1 RNA polymerase sigma factor [Mucilaginibacter ginkgonis]